MKRLIALISIIASVNSFAAYTIEAGFELRQDGAYKKLSKFLFWKNYKGTPTFLEITDTRTGLTQNVDGVSELSVTLGKDCYKKIKKVKNAIAAGEFNDQILYFRGELKELKLVPGKKSKLKLNKNSSDYPIECDFEDA
jgi:hypothetical protein